MNHGVVTTAKKSIICIPVGIYNLYSRVSFIEQHHRELFPSERNRALRMSCSWSRSVRVGAPLHIMWIFKEEIYRCYNLAFEITIWHKMEDLPKIFDDIYQRGLWSEGPGTPLSGPGSSIRQTSEVVDFLEKFISEHNITSVMDLGCGDLTWISKWKPVITGQLEYTGIDCSSHIIELNHNNYPSINCSCGDIMSCSLPANADLYICRDVLSHLNNDDVVKVIGNILHNVTGTVTNRENSYQLVARGDAFVPEDVIDNKYVLFSWSGDSRTDNSTRQVAGVRWHYSSVDLTAPPFYLTKWMHRFKSFGKHHGVMSIQQLVEIWMTKIVCVRQISGAFGTHNLYTPSMRKTVRYLKHAKLSTRIPTTIHFIWLNVEGDDIPEKQQRIINSWTDGCPGWTIKVWTNSHLTV